MQDIHGNDSKSKLLLPYSADNLEPKILADGSAYHKNRLITMRGDDLQSKMHNRTFESLIER